MANILLIILVIFAVWSIFRSFKLRFEIQINPYGLYAIWSTDELNFHGEYYKLTHRRLIWKMKTN
jgi:hypothetical protein